MDGLNLNLLVLRAVDQDSLDILLGSEAAGLRLQLNMEARDLASDGLAIHLGGEPLPPVVVEPVKPHHGRNIGWGKAERRDRVWGVGFESKRRFVAAKVSACHQQLATVQKQVQCAWSNFSTLDVSKKMGSWSSMDQLSRSWTLAYLSLFGRDVGHGLRWKQLKPRDVAIVVAYRAPGPKDGSHVLSWQKTSTADSSHRFSYKVLWPKKDAPLRVYWGDKYYEAVCNRDYPIPDPFEITLNIDQDISTVGDALTIDLHLNAKNYDERCSQREPSGWRDRYHYIKPPILPTGLSLRTYIMMSSAQINRLPDNLAIPVKGFSLSYDWDSLHWAVDATVIGGDVRDLSPTEDGPIEIEAKINGVDWVCIVDTWKRDVAFASHARSISGRGQSAYLGAPWARKKIEVQGEARTARQLMDEQLLNTGWAISSTLVDWLIPAGTLAIDKMAPLAVIKKIAEAVGGFVRPDPKTKTIYVAPKYKVAPWRVKRSDADMVLPAAMIIKDAGVWDGREKADSVHITGGISLFAKREGTAGALSVGDINEPLITEVDAGRARAIYEVGRAGRWEKHSLSLPLFENEVPGLIVPGMIIAVDDSSSWVAFVASTAIRAEWSAKGLVVRQQVSLERYMGD